jgi:alpha-L-rhamnosidase
MVPWAVYESYGDPGILERQLPSMRRWVESLVRRQAPDGLLRPSWQFGDWLDPDAPSDEPWKAKANSDFIANAFFAWSANLLGDAEALIGDRASARKCHALAAQVAAGTWNRWSEEARRTQTGCAIALRFGIAPDSERASVADALAQLVDEAQGRVATGFLGTPLVLPALSDAGLFDQAYRMLLCTENPSWLYQVEHGATTVWERWDAIRPDGSIHPGTLAPLSQAGEAEAEGGHMLSFNHYAYGAVIDWVYRNLAGLAPDRERPGYAHVRFAPKPVTGLHWARASVESRFGTVSIDWRVDSDRFIADVVLPVGATGTFIPPVTVDSLVTLNDESVAIAPITLTAGTHHVEVTRPAIALTS